jgi:hypothetical protein
MIQVAAWLSTVLDGLSDRHHPRGNCIYAVRDGDRFIYIGKTDHGVWARMRAHMDARGPLWGAVRTAGALAAHWHVQGCNFLREPSTLALEAELIHRHHPLINATHNRARRPRAHDQFGCAWLDRHPSPAYQTVFATGWPAFAGIELDALPERYVVAPNSPIRTDGALPADAVALHHYQLLTPLEQEALQFWIAYAVAPTKQADSRDYSKALRWHFDKFGFPVAIEAFQGAMLMAGYIPVWNNPRSGNCTYRLRHAMRHGQSESKWRNRTQLAYVQALDYTWYWPTDALEQYSTLLDKLGESTKRARERIQLLVAVKFGQVVDWRRWD